MHRNLRVKLIRKWWVWWELGVTVILNAIDFFFFRKAVLNKQLLYNWCFYIIGSFLSWSRTDTYAPGSPGPSGEDEKGHCQDSLPVFFPPGSCQFQGLPGWTADGAQDTSQVLVWLGYKPHGRKSPCSSFLVVFKQSMTCNPLVSACQVLGFQT